MKLHLPKALLSAVLAVVGGSSVYATTYTVTQGGNSLLHSCTFTDESTNKTAGWSSAAANNSDAILHFVKSDAAATELEVQYNSFCAGGIITDVGTNITGIKHNNDRSFYIGKDEVSTTSTINSNFTFTATNGIYLSGNQSWSIAENTTYTFTGSDVTNTAAITMSGSGSVDFTNKTISGNGSIYVSEGTFKNATFAEGATLSLGNNGDVAKITMNSGSVLDLTNLTLSSTTAAVDTSKIKLESGTIVNLSNISDGQSVKISDNLPTNIILTIDNKSTARSTYTVNDGVYTFSKVVTVLNDMVWAGGDGTWNKSNTNWNSATYGNGIAFVNGDTVTFDSSAAVVVGEGVSVEEMIVSGDKTTLELTRENSGYIAGKVTITDDATMIIKSKTDQTGFVRGEINVEDGILQFNAKDVTGYNGGANSTSKITIAAGSELLLNHDSNETFAGTLVLNGTLKGITTNKSQWDLFGGGKDGGSAKIIVEDNQNAIIKNTTIRLRQRDSVFELGAGSTLEIEDIIKSDVGNADSYTAKIITKGTGQLTANGSIQADVIEITEGGTITMKDDSAVSTEVRVLRGALNVGTKDSDAVLSTARLELGDSGSSGNGSMLNIASNSLVKVTGNGNSGDYNGCSLMLGEWTAKATVNIDGSLLAKDAKAVTGDAGMVINVNKGGTMAVAGIGIANRKDEKPQAITLDVKDGGKLILGSSGIEANLKDGSGITLNAGTIGMYADTTTLGAAMTLSSTTGTIFDTAKYAFATDGNSISQTATAAGGEMTASGVLSGTGKLIKQGAGTLKLTASNTYSGGTEIQGGILQASTGNALGTGNVSITGGSLNVTSDSVTISQRSSGINSTIEFVTGGENQLNSSRVYSISSDAHQVNNARVEIAKNNDATISNRLMGVNLVNKGTGKLSAGNGFNNFTAIHADLGSIALYGYGAQGKQGIVNELIINNRLTVEAYTNWEGTLNAATIEATAFTVGEKSILKANLTLTNGATLTLNGYGDDAATINGNLTLSAELKLAGEEFLEALGNLESGEMLKLFEVTGEFSGLEATLSIAADAIEETQPLIAGYDATNYYSSLNVGDYALVFQQSALFIKNTATIPEPTTATLSLLALTALAARRRRK